MKRLLTLLLLAFCATSVRADEGDWRNVRLFDWIYSGEAGYQMLKQAAEAAGEHGWVAQRLEKGQKVPQASARDLALELEDSEKVDPALKESLKAQFADESGQLGKLDKVSLAEASAQLQASLDRASAKLDQLEASIKSNSYGKGSNPGVSLNMYSMYREDAPSGLDQGDTHGYFGGGLQILMNGTIGKTNFNLELTGEYWYNNLSSSDYDYYNDLLDAGASFEIPLETGGLDVVLGQAQDLMLSPLLFANLLAVNRDGFYVDVTQPFRAPKLIKTMELGYPAGTYHFRGAYIKRTGSVWYWPFTTTEFVYTPADSTWWHNWDAKFTTTLLKLDEDIGPHGHWLDGGDVYAIASGSGSDQDQNNAAEISGNILEQYAKDYSIGTEIRFSSGSLFRADVVYSSFYCLTNPVITNQTGDAWIATLVQPVGPLNVAFEMGQASPGFQSAGHVYNDGTQAGVTQDTIQMNRGTYDQASIPGVTQTQWLNNGNSFNHPVYTTMINQPTELNNNSQRMAFKTEWHGSWVSVGLYDGIVQELQPTDAYVMTTPYIEGSILNGYGWFRMLGQTFSQGPDPGSNGGAPSPYGITMGPWLQGQFNHFTDSSGILPTSTLQAIDANGVKHPVHWQMLTQLNNYDAEFLVLLTKHGKGDLNLMPDSVKTLNYAGGNVMFDFAALSNRTEPLQLTIVGEDRDLSTAPAVPTLGESSLFNQQFVEGFLNVGVSDSVNLLAMAGYEVWQTQQSYFPLFIQVNEVGLGMDYNADAVVTGMQFNLRGTIMKLHDSNIGARDLTLQSLSVGSTLAY